MNPRTRWTALALFFVARLALGFQFQSIGSVAPLLIDEFTLRYVDIGTLVGVFLLPGAFVAVPGGVLGKRFGDRRVVLCGIALMIVGGVLDALSSSYWSLIIGRIVSGTGAAVLVVLMSKMVADWFVGRDLVFAMSVYIVGWPAGIAIAQATQAVIAVESGWRMSLHSTAMLAAIAFMLLGLIYRDPRVAEGPPLGRRFERDKMLPLCLAGAVWMLVNAAYIILLTFGPAMLTEQGNSLTVASFTVSLMSWTSIFVLPIGALLGARYRIVDLMMFMGLIASTGLAVYLPFTSSHQFVFSLFGMTYSLALPVVASLPARLLSPRDRNLGFGIYWLWFYAGIPILTGLSGYLRDLTGRAASPAFLSAAILMLALLLLFCLRGQQPANDA